MVYYPFHFTNLVKHYVPKALGAKFHLTYVQQNEDKYPIFSTANLDHPFPKVLKD